MAFDSRWREFCGIRQKVHKNFVGGLNTLHKPHGLFKNPIDIFVSLASINV